MAKTKNKINHGLSDKFHAKKTKEKSKKKMNPFEVHVNKEKFKIIGKKRKNDIGLPGVSRAKAMKKRKNTLGYEMKLANKSNTFLDKRIGEKNNALSEEEKIMARFTAEKLQQHRSKAGKRSIYNLADDEILTHRGQTLEEIEKFDDPRSDDEDEDMLNNRSGKLQDDFVSDANFGGGVLSRSENIDGAKSRKDVIEQLILESKKRKIEKQKLKEETLDLTEKLDTQWKDLQPVVSKNFNKETEGKEDEPSLIDKLLKKQEKKNQEYDKTMMQLKFEPRGTPSNRLKSEDEIAKFEKEKLEKLERDRLARMHGVSDEKSIKHRSADDLDDDYQTEPDPDVMIAYNSEGKLLVPIGGLKKDGDKADDSIDDEETDSEEGEHDSGSDEDSLNDLRDNMDDESGEEQAPVKKRVSFNFDSACKTIERNDGEKKSILKSNKNVVVDNNLKLSAKKEKETVKLNPGDELPFTFDMPKNYEELFELLQNRSAEHQFLIVERIIKCNHPSLKEGNKEKLGTLFAYLMQLINDVFSDDSLSDESCLKQAFKAFDRLLGHFYNLAQMDPNNAKNCIVDILKEKYEDFKLQRRKVPGMDTLIYFKLISSLFSTSDLRHPVVTPCFHFVSQILCTAKVKNSIDVSRGLFLVAVMSEYTSISKRFLPAALNFLRGVLCLYSSSAKPILPFTPDERFLRSEKKRKNVDSPNDRMLPIYLLEEVTDDNFKLTTLTTVLKLLKTLSDRTRHLNVRRAILGDHLNILNEIVSSNCPSSIVASFNETKARFEERKSLVPLKEETKPKSIRLYEPAIENEYSGKKKRIMSKEKGEYQRLLHRHKKEMKGALREIRRDKAFITSVKIKEKIQSDNLRKEKVKRIFSEASLQQGELNALHRSKKKKK